MFSRLFRAKREEAPEPVELTGEERQILQSKRHGAGHARTESSKGRNTPRSAPHYTSNGGGA